jgi:hypothetical protein
LADYPRQEGADRQTDPQEGFQTQEAKGNSMSSNVVSSEETKAMRMMRGAILD